MTEQPTLPPDPGPAAEIEAMRLKLRDAVESCTDLAMDYAVQIIARTRAEKRLARAEQRIIEVEAARDTLLRKEAAGRPDQRLEAVKASRQEWADLAYEMWELLRPTELGSIVDVDAISAFSDAKDSLGDRLTALIEQRDPRTPSPAEVPGAWWPTRDHDGKITAHSATVQAIGSASMCWEHVDRAGVFDDAQARKVHTGLMAFLSDWADEIRKQANQAYAAKMKAAERW